MKKLSIVEFEKKCSEIRPAGYLIATKNQNEFRKCDDVSVKLCFETVEAMLNPNTIWFKNGGNYMCFDRVKYVDFYEGKNSIRFNIVCGERNSGSKDRSYMIYAI